MTSRVVIETRFLLLHGQCELADSIDFAFFSQDSPSRVPAEILRLIRGASEKGGRDKSAAA